MRTSRLLILAIALLAMGFITVGSNWHGDFGFNVGAPLTANSLRFNGSATGASALVGIITIPLGLIALLLTLISAVIDETGRK